MESNTGNSLTEEYAAKAESQIRKLMVAYFVIFAFNFLVWMAVARSSQSLGTSLTYIRIIIGVTYTAILWVFTLDLGRKLRLGKATKFYLLSYFIPLAAPVTLSLLDQKLSERRKRIGDGGSDAAAVEQSETSKTALRSEPAVCRSCGQVVAPKVQWCVECGRRV